MRALVVAVFVVIAGVLVYGMVGTLQALAPPRDTAAGELVAGAALYALGALAAMAAAWHYGHRR